MSQKLINHRNSYQRNVLRLGTSCLAFDENSTLSAVTTSLELLEEYWTKFQVVQLNIEEKASDENLDAELEVMIETETSYAKTKSVLKTILDLKEKESNDSEEEGEQNRCTRYRNVKLPKLKVPKFDGSFCNWVSFRDLFTSMVRNDKSLTNCEKLQYLKPNCDGEAEDIVSNYKITDANFDAAWADLENRYENKRLQIQAHLDKLFDQEIISNEGADALRLLLRTTQKCVRSLESLGGPVESWDWLLVQIVGMRLDPKTRRYCELLHPSKEMPTWQQMVTALENRCNALDSLKSS